MSTYRGVNALVGAFSMIVKTDCATDGAPHSTNDAAASGGPVHPAERGEHGGPRGGGRPDHHGQLHVRTQGPAQPINQVTLNKSIVGS